MGLWWQSFNKAINFLFEVLQGLRTHLIQKSQNLRLIRINALKVAKFQKKKIIIESEYPVAKIC